MPSSRKGKVRHNAAIALAAAAAARLQEVWPTLVQGLAAGMEMAAPQCARPLASSWLVSQEAPAGSVAAAAVDVVNSRGGVRRHSPVCCGADGNRARKRGPAGAPCGADPPALSPRLAFLGRCVGHRPRDARDPRRQRCRSWGRPSADLVEGSGHPPPVLACTAPVSCRMRSRRWGRSASPHSRMPETRSSGSRRRRSQTP